MLRSDDHQERAFAAAGLGLILLVIVSAAIGLDRLALTTWTGILTLAVLVVVSLPVLFGVARSAGHPGTARILILGMLATVAAVGVRILMAAAGILEAADSNTYARGAAPLAKLYREGVFTTVPPGIENYSPETQRVAVVLAVVYLLTGASRLAGTLVFAWLGLAGRLLMWRALIRAVPEADHHRYLLIVLFFPSLVFWPATLGKESLMLFALGLVSWGASLLLSERVTFGSIGVFATGVAGLTIIRPHLAAIAVAALGLASIVGTLGSVGQGAKLKTTAVRVAALVVLIVAAALVLTQTAESFGGLGEESGVGDVLENTREQTSIGGSSFDAPGFDSPVAVPWAVVTVFFRPFLWEVDNTTSLVSSLEGLALLGFVAVSWRRLIGGTRMVFKRPYLVFVLTFTGAFVAAFSYIGNFGILARQRTVMLPLFFVFLAAPPIARGRRTLFGPRPGRRSLDEPPERASSVSAAQGSANLSPSAQVGADS